MDNLLWKRHLHESGDTDEGFIKFSNFRCNAHGLCNQHATPCQGHHSRRSAKLGNHDGSRTPRLRSRALPRRDEASLLLTGAECAATMPGLAAQARHCAGTPCQDRPRQQPPEPYAPVVNHVARLTQDQAAAEALHEHGLRLSGESG